MDTAGETRLQHKRNFAEFLEPSVEYAAQIKELAEGAEDGKPIRLSLNLDDLLRANQDLHRSLLDRPAECLPPFLEALDELVR
jgi:DNA replication licensing factor MCM3